MNEIYDAVSRLPIGGRLILNNKYVYREARSRFMVNGHSVGRVGTEYMNTFFGRVTCFIEGRKFDVADWGGFNHKSYHRDYMREKRARGGDLTAKCIDCHGPCSPRARTGRCMKCYHRHRVEAMKDDFEQRITAGEMEP